MIVKHRNIKADDCKHSKRGNSRHRQVRVSRIVRLSLATFLSFFFVLTMTSCKPSDLFTEIIISPFSETVWDTAEPMIINSPDAEQESGELAAIEWTDESPTSEEVQNITLFSNEPTSTLTTHHSIYDIMPLFKGAFSSDGVRLLFNKDTEEEQQTDATEQDETIEQDLETTSAGGQVVLDTILTMLESYNNSLSQPSSAGTGSAHSGTTPTERGLGGSVAQILEDADSENSQQEQEPLGEATSSDAGQGEIENDEPDGTDENPDGGFAPFDGMNDLVVDPGNMNVRDRINEVQHLAVLGTDAAVMVQSLGGKGAICATSVEAYDGISYDPAGNKAMTYSSFKDVFADELPDGLPLLWDNDGSSPGDLASIDNLVQACGENGVIMYEQNTLGYYDDIFSYDQRESIYNAGIQLIPLDFSSVQGILDAADAIGKALNNSDECEQDAEAMATTYVNFVNDIVNALAQAQGGALALKNSSETYYYSQYNSCNLSCYQTKIRTYIATGWESGLTYTGGSPLNTSGITLFIYCNTLDDTPLYFWEQAGGAVWEGNDVSSLSGGYILLNPTSIELISENFRGGGKVWSSWVYADNTFTDGAHTDMRAKELGAGELGGLGSENVPYLIVCASNDRSAEWVKSEVLKSMNSYSGNETSTAMYEAMPYGSNLAKPQSSSTNISSNIGLQPYGNYSESPFYTGLSANDVVRENPLGLLSSWTEGNMESVLEAAWLAQIYSESPGGCSYVPAVNMSNFSVNIAGITCTTLNDVVCTFYQTFYRFDAGNVYSQIVTDE